MEREQQAQVSVSLMSKIRGLVIFFLKAKQEIILTFASLCCEYFATVA